jgi:predicted transcriptional regulator
MTMTTISLQIPDVLLAQVRDAASQHHVRPDDVLLSAVEHYLALDIETRLAVEEGIRQLDAGESFSHEEVMARYHARRLRDQAA